MNGLAGFIVALALVGGFLVVKEAESSSNQPPPVTMIQCDDGTIRSSCPGVAAQPPSNPPPDEPEDDPEPDPRRGSLNLYDGQYYGIEGSKRLRVDDGDAAIVQAWRINSSERCEVAGVIGPASVSVEAGEAYYFRDVHASESDLYDALDEAARLQQADPEANCSDSHVVIIS